MFIIYLLFIYYYLFIIFIIFNIFNIFYSNLLNILHIIRFVDNLLDIYHGGYLAYYIYNTGLDTIHAGLDYTIILTHIYTNSLTL